MWTTYIYVYIVPVVKKIYIFDKKYKISRMEMLEVVKLLYVCLTYFILVVGDGGFADFCYLPCSIDQRMYRLET